MYLTNKTLTLLIGLLFFGSIQKAEGQEKHIIEIGAIDSVYSDILKASV